MEDSSVVNLNVTALLAFGQRRQDGPIDGLDVKEAIMNGCGREVVCMIPLQHN